jgi:ketosteroid isomerase-like protein
MARLDLSPAWRHSLGMSASLSLPPVTADDQHRISDWFRELADHVQAVDFAAARHLFAEDFVAFGTYSDFIIGREATEAKQWRNVWGTIDGFHFLLDDIHAQVSPDRLFANGMAVFHSTGFLKDGTPFDRKGRTTVTLQRQKVGDPWVATHTHMSLFRGTPDVSHGHKPARS